MYFSTMVDFHISKYYVYHLKDECGGIFYVGHAYSPSARLQVHQTKYGKDITLTVIRTTRTKITALKWEIYYTNEYEKSGIVLKNKRIGNKYRPSARTNITQLDR